MARIGAQKDEAGPAHLVEKAQMPPHPGEHVVDVKLEPDAIAHDDQIRWQCHVDPRILGVAGASGRGLRAYDGGMGWGGGRGGVRWGRGEEGWELSQIEV